MARGAALGLAAAGFAAAFKRGDALGQRFILVARGGGHRFDRIEFVAADEIHPADPFAHLLAHRSLGFAAHPGGGAGKAVHHLDQIVEHPIFGLHFELPWFPLWLSCQIGTQCRSRQ